MHLKGDKVLLDDGEYSNYVSIDGFDYDADYLVAGVPGSSQSPNGSIFRIFASGADEVQPQVMKVCGQRDPNDPRRVRFEREIAALRRAKERGKSRRVIEILNDGEQSISGHSLRYYTMEAADRDLAAFLEEETLEMQQKFVLCHQMALCIESLHQIGIYHRDIKPANFLFVGGEWKIADLGLAAFRDDDIRAIDGADERVGPRGYLSPEALNKWLGRCRQTPVIDEKSDVFQLAKVMGFVLQSEILTGMLEPEDLLVDHPAKLFEIMSKALQYNKKRRCDLGTLRADFESAFGAMYALV